MNRTIAALPTLLADGGLVLWTRGAENPEHDRSQEIRRQFEQAGFAEVSFTATPDGAFRVGLHRLLRPAPSAAGPAPGERLFTFG